MVKINLFKNDWGDDFVNNLIKWAYYLKIFEWKSARTILENFEYSLQETNQSSFSNNKVNGVKTNKPTTTSLSTSVIIPTGHYNKLKK